MLRRFGTREARRLASRRAAVLLLVLAAIPVLTMGAYTFTHWMRAEAEGSVAALRLRRTKLLAESGVDRVRALLDDPLLLDSMGIDLGDSPETFAAQSVGIAEAGVEAGYYSLVAPPLDDSATLGGAGQGNAMFRFGLDPESSRIPLHNPNLELTADALLYIPGMTDELADAILDWVDDDAELRDFGAEADDYMILDPPYSARDGAPRSIGELLLVTGMTAELLYGEDANLDGILDANENDSDASWPTDNGDGVLDRGFAAYFTTRSASSNRSSSGEPKININGEDVDLVVEEVSAAFDADIAEFIREYRESKGDEGIASVSELFGAQIGGGGENAEQPVPGMDQASETALEEMAEAAAEAAASGGGGGQGGDNEEAKASPWTEADAGELLEPALDLLTVVEGESAPGQIDPKYAPMEVLMCLPEITEEVAELIAGAGADRRGNYDPTLAWLVNEGVLTLEEFKKWEPFLTARGSVFRVRSIGFSTDHGVAARVEAIVDGSSRPVRVLERRELTGFARPYDLETISGGQLSSTTR